MSENSNDRTLKIISDHHEQIAAFARESYKHDGRGVVQVSFPNVPPGHTASGMRMMKYILLEQVQKLTSGARADDAATLVQMLETYEPERQAVVMAAIDGELPVTIKMKLEPPTLVEGSEQIH